MIALGANYLSMSEQGIFSYVYLFYVGIVVINLALIYQWSSVKAPLVESRENYKNFLLNTQIFFAFGTSFFLLFALKILSLVSNWELPFGICGLIFIYFYFQQISDFARRAAYVFQTPREAFINSLFIYPIRIALIFILRPSTIEGFILLIGLTSLLPAIYLILTHLKFIKYDKRFFSDFRNHFNEVKWLLIGTPFSFLWGNIPVFISGIVLNLDSVGLFTSLNSITNVGNIGMELLDTEFSSRLGKTAAEDKKKSRKVYQNIFILGIAFWFIALGIFLVFGKYIIEIIDGPAYVRGQQLLIYQWVTVLFMFIFRVDAVWIRTLGDTKTLLRSSIIGTAVAIIVSWPMIHFFGEIGIALAVTLAAVAIGLYQRVILWKNKEMESSIKI
jgi:O-antigen/teichoic acid export membrane protein